MFWIIVTIVLIIVFFSYFVIKSKDKKRVNKMLQTYDGKENKSRKIPPVPRASRGTDRAEQRVSEPEQNPLGDDESSGEFLLPPEAPIHNARYDRSLKRGNRHNGRERSNNRVNRRDKKRKDKKDKLGKKWKKLKKKEELID